MALSIVVDAERKPKFLPPLEKRPQSARLNAHTRYPKTCRVALSSTHGALLRLLLHLALSEAVRWFSDRPLDSDEGTPICVRVEENEIARFEWIELIGAHHNP